MSGFWLEQAVITNFRCIPEVRIEFDRHLTVLVGPNGGGKTAILDAIALHLKRISSLYLGESDSSELEVDPKDRRLVKPLGQQSSDMEFAGLSHVLVFESPKTWEYHQALRIGVEMDKPVQLPVLAYYGTTRLCGAPESAIPESTSRMVGYRNAIEAGSGYRDFARWYRYWSQNALNEKLIALQAGGTPKPSEFDAWIESVDAAVNACMSTTSGWNRIEYSFRLEDVVAHHEKHGRLRVSQLSDGIRSMVGMIADIAFRATKLNPHLGKDASRLSDGVVLIDEVDLHLHPEWQQVVLTGLTSAFPNMQFIVTTHSPQVLSSVKRECIRSLEWDNGLMLAAIPSHETFGEESRAALEDVLHVSPFPPTDANRRMAAYLKRIEGGQDGSAEARALRTELERDFGSGNSRLQLADMLIRRNEAKRKQALG